MKKSFSRIYLNFQLNETTSWYPGAICWIWRHDISFMKILKVYRKQNVHKCLVKKTSAKKFNT